MKKLTKTLSLVLVVAMVLGLCMIGAGATFTDNSKITKDYSEAVTIMTDLKVVGGYKNGSFNPAGTLTRAEACVIMANMTLGSTSAAGLAPTTVSFKDVPASFWGYKFVEYCYQAGYIAGTGNGNFSPSATLTGYQWALMLMKVRGVDTTGMTSGNWKINTAKAYYATGTKFSTVTISDAGVTREAATKMAYDALFTSLSGKTGYPLKKDGTVIAVYDTVAEAYMMQTMMTNLADGHTYTVGATMVPMGTDYMAKTVFGVTLDTTTGTDAFARPANVYTATTATQGTTYGWTNKVKTIASEPAITYTSAVKTGKIYADLGLTTGTTGTKVLGTSVFTNGTAGATPANDVVLNLNGTAVVGGNGILTEVYTDSNGIPTRIVEVNSSMGKVTAVTTGKEANGSTYTQYTIGTGASFTATSTNYKVYTSALNNELDTIKISGTIAKGDFVVLYTDNATGLLGAAANMTYATKANLVSGKLTSYSSSTGLYTIGGTTYAQSGITTTGTSAVAAYNTTATYALDNYGYVVGSVTVDATASYLYVTKMYSSYVLSGTTLVQTVMASVMMPDGTVKAIAVATVNNGAASVGATPIANEGLYTYQVNEDGSYALSAMIAGQGVTSITQKTSALNGGTTMYTNSDTKYYVANWVTDTKTTADDNANDKSLDGTVTSYTGYTNVPSMTVNAGDAAYVDADNNGIAEVVFIFRNTAVGVTTNYTYMLGTASTTNGTAFANDAIVAGATTTVTLNSQPTAGLYVVNSGTATAVDFGNAYADPGHLLGTRPWTASNDGIYHANYIVCNGGLLYIASSATNLVTAANYVSSVATTVPVYVISASAKTCTASTVADFTNATLGDVVVANTAGVISAIYVVVA